MIMSNRSVGRTEDAALLRGPPKEKRLHQKTATCLQLLRRPQVRDLRDLALLAGVGRLHA
jgi:hypothetical protein